jgi:IPT/TIG domain-containing protein
MLRPPRIPELTQSGAARIMAPKKATGKRCAMPFVIRLRRGLAPRFFHLLLFVLLVAPIAALMGCGGGGTSQPAQDFALALSPTSMALQQLGDGATLIVSITPVNGLGGSVTITFPNLPAGISVASVGFSSGPPYVASPGQGLSVGITASQAAAVGNSTITIQGTSASLAHSTTLGISVSAAAVFQLTVSPSTVAIGPNGMASAQVTLVPGANFGSSTILLSGPSVQIGNTGVYVSISSEFLTAAQPQATVTFQSGLEVQTGSNIPVPLSGILGAQVVNVPLALSITNPAPLCNSLSRSTSRRTDMDPTGVVYDSLRKLVYAAVDQNNFVQVYSSATGQTVATIPIVAARQLDMTADGSQLLVGSLTGYMSWVDPTTFEVTQRVPLPASLSNGLYANLPYQTITLANGNVFLVFTELLGGGYSPVEWNPTANTLTNVLPPGLSAGDLVFSRSADHSRVLAFSVSAGVLGVFDSTSDSFGPVQNISVSAAALNPNGSQVAVVEASPTIPGGNQVVLFDSQFNTLATYQFNAQSDAGDLIFSRDGNYLYVFAGGAVVVLNASGLSLAGVVSSSANLGVGYPPDIDETGMIFVPGIGQRALYFVDASSPCALGINEPFNMSLSPPQGVVSSPSQTTLSAVSGLTSSSQIYFGAPPASPQVTPGTNLVYSPPTSIQVTAPAATQAGAVNVTVTNPDGSVAIYTDGFSYGSNALAVTPTSGPATGATSVTVYGYGFDFDKSQIQVTVGGKVAVVTNAFPGPGISPFPFPMDQVQFTVPAGNSGAADIVITTPAGSATVARGFHYLQNVQSFAVSSTLGEVVYDQSRQRLYATDYGTNKVDVFDLTGQQFLTPLPVGNSPLGLAVTPDFTTLVVANSADNTISIVDLTGGTATKTVSLANLAGLPQLCGPPFPYAVATTSSNLAVIAITCPNVTEGQFVVLNLATQAIGCGTSQGCAAMMSAISPYVSEFLFLAATADGTQVFVSNGNVGLWNVSSDTFTSQPLFSPGSNLGVLTAAASDGTWFASDFNIVDPMLYLSSVMQDVDYLQTGANGVNTVFGEKLHPSGALLYVPQNNGVDIYDAPHGHIARRIVLPLQVPITFDAMAIDETGTEVFLITSTGLTIVNIADLPVGVGSVTPSQGSASGGVSVQIRGSGFESGATVMFGSAAAAVSFVDSSTLQAITPALPVGAARITVVNPDGTQYALDDAFTAN